MKFSITGGPGGLLLDTGVGPSFLPLPNVILEQVAAGNSDPGVTTLKMPDLLVHQNHQRLPAEILTTREIDVELCFVCKKCRIAFPGESQLLTHQRQCYGGGNLDNRGAYRIVQTGYECKMCGGERFKSLQELKKHFDTEQHLKVIKGTSIGQIYNASTTFNVTTSITTITTSSTSSSSSSQLGSSLPPPSESPLSHEMEDVVNQITLLAARAAAQETGPDTSTVRSSTGLDTNSNNNFCQPAEPKRRFLSPADVVQPLTSAGH